MPAGHHLAGGAKADLVDRVHAYGGLWSSTTSPPCATPEKAAAAGVDGLILVCAGAGGHAGVISPFALVPEVRAFSTARSFWPAASPTGAAWRRPRPWAPTSLSRHALHCDQGKHCAGRLQGHAVRQCQAATSSTRLSISGHPGKLPAPEPRQCRARSKKPADQARHQHGRRTRHRVEGLEEHLVGRPGRRRHRGRRPARPSLSSASDASTAKPSSRWPAASPPPRRSDGEPA